MEQRDFFISYTKVDETWAVWIANVLKKNGYSVYVQALDIRPGDDFLEKMEAFLENSRNFIAVWSKGYSKSRYCMNELRAAYHEWNAGRMNYLLPVRVDDFPMKALYAALVHVELSDRGAASEAILADAVRRGVPRNDTADTATNTPEPEEDAETLYQRGEDYYYGGNGVRQDYAKARQYYEQAAAKGNANALYNLGCLYSNGYGVAQNYTKARDYYEQAAAKGHVDALYNLGVYYKNGKGVPQDYAKALEYFQKAADAGDEDASAKIEEMREKLNPSEDTPKEDAETLNKRGNDYYHGKNGVNRDYAKARDYYEQAAVKGHASALYNLGVLYEFGGGVAVDYGKAREYYEQAAAKGHASALFHLGLLYERGVGVTRDYAKAQEYYEQAATKGHAFALFHLGVLYEQWVLIRDYGKAREYYEQAAAKGHASALFRLGYFYDESFGVRRNYGKAREYYEQAAAKGHASALYNLGVFYEHGRGVAIDYAKALEYYQKAADAGHKNASAQVERLRKMLNS